MKNTILLLLLFTGAAASAQRYKLIAGKLENVKGIESYDVTFNYDNLTVHGYETEAEFLADKMKKRQNVEGKAEQFKEEWFANREKLYEPAFISYFNKLFKNGEIQIGKHPGARYYTMNVKTTWIYPGYNAGTAIEPAKISAIITIMQTEHPENILVAIEFEKAIGLEHELGNSQGDRISWAYEKLAKILALQLKRFL
jgi:hypothetical protein